MGNPADVWVELAILHAEIRGLDDAYARLALERINKLADDAVKMLPETHHSRFLSIMRTAQSG